MIPLLSDVEVDELRYNPDWTKTKGKCPTCEGTGFYIDAKTEQETECPEDDFGHSQLRLFKLYSNANIPTEYQTLDWDEYPHEGIKTVVDEYCLRLNGALHWGVGHLFYGKNKGVGKTWAGVQILKQAIAHNYSAFFSTFEDFKRNEFDAPEIKQWRIGKMRSANFLVIDDVKEPTTSRETAFYQDLLEYIVRHRTQHALPLILTTNIENINDFYPNLRSMLDGHVNYCMVTGNDFRPTLWHQKEEALLNNYKLPIL